MEDKLDLIALCAVPDLGPVSIRNLIAAFGSAGEVFRASPRALRSVENIGEERAKNIKSFAGRDELGRSVEKLVAQGVKLLVEGDEDYPVALKGIGADAPLVLYVKGDILKEDMFAVAIVGSRKLSHYGAAVTEKISAELAGMGLTVVSGLARGIDTTAHTASINAGGRSIGVLGSGIDVPYPPENKGLMEKLAASGCVVSEFPPGMPPNRENFPRRNRLISGLSMGVLVVEADKRSGALITAKFALEQGKEVFAVPGNINSPVSHGPNELIKRGARAVTCAEDIVEELAPVLKGFIKKEKKSLTVELTDEERALYDIMSQEPMHIDAVTRQSGMQASKALHVLLALELKGVVKQIEGKKFHRI